MTNGLVGMKNTAPDEPHVCILHVRPAISPRPAVPRLRPNLDAGAQPEPRLVFRLAAPDRAVRAGRACLARPRDLQSAQLRVRRLQIETKYRGCGSSNCC